MFYQPKMIAAYMNLVDGSISLVQPPHQEFFELTISQEREVADTAKDLGVSPDEGAALLFANTVDKAVEGGDMLGTVGVMYMEEVLKWGTARGLSKDVMEQLAARLGGEVAKGH